jgi:hypothetical protein
MDMMVERRRLTVFFDVRNASNVAGQRRIEQAAATPASLPRTTLSATPTRRRHGRRDRDAPPWLGISLVGFCAR